MLLTAQDAGGEDWRSLHIPQSGLEAVPGPEVKLSFLLTNLTANTSYSAMIRSAHIYNQYTNLHKSAHIYTPYIFIYSLHTRKPPLFSLVTFEV